MNNVLAMLPTLNKKELEAVIAVASELLGASNAPASPLAALVFDAISGALNKPSVLGTLPVTLQKRLVKNVPQLITLLNTDFQGWDETKNLQIAVLRYMMILLRVDLEGFIQNPSYKSMIDNLPRMGEAFDKAFPSYRKSKLGDVILMKMQRRVSTNDKTKEKDRTNRNS